MSRIKDDQKMKSGQLLEYNMKNIFSCRKYGGETIPRPFSQTSKLSASLNQYYEVLSNLFLLYDKLRAKEIYPLKLSCRPLAFTSFKAFLKKKKGLKLVFLPHYCMTFKEKYFSYYTHQPIKFHSGCLYFVRYWAICVL